MWNVENPNRYFSKINRQHDNGISNGEFLWFSVNNKISAPVVQNSRFPSFYITGSEFTSWSKGLSNGLSDLDAV